MVKKIHYPYSIRSACWIAPAVKLDDGQIVCLNEFSKFLAPSDISHVLAVVVVGLLGIK